MTLRDEVDFISLMKSRILTDEALLSTVFDLPQFRN